MNKVGIVFLNYNDGERTLRLVDSIKNYESIRKIVIVDNCSTDNSCELLRHAVQEKVDVVGTEQNKGYSYGNNVGINKLLETNDVSIVGIANTDIEFKEDFILKIKKDFDKHPDWGIITGLQLSPKGTVAMHPFWAVKKTWTSFIYERLGNLYFLGKMFKIHPDYDYAQEKLGKAETVFEVGTVEGSLFFIRKELFERIGFFDENLFLYCEEDVIGIKVSRTPFKIIVDSEVKYIHFGGETTKAAFSSVKKVRIMNRSKHYYLKTYVSHNIIVSMLHRIISLTIVVETFFISVLKKIMKL